MSLTTRCPACATLFRVVPDQLKVSEGWVRCGRCSEVFDARLTLSPSLPVVTEVVEPPEQVAVQVSQEVVLQESTSEAMVAVASTSDAMARGANDPALEPRPAGEPVADAPAAASADAAQPARSEQGPDASTIEPTSPQAGDGPRLEPSLAAPAADGAPTPLPETVPPVEEVSFVRDARRRAFWRRPGVRWTLAIASLLLALGLALQATLHWRNQLALAAPGLQPALQVLCIPFKCRVGAPRMIESVTFDGSSFTRLQPDVYRLNVTLANSATVPVAMPSLELTLTDSQDQPVLRRVLLPGDYGSEVPSSLPAGGEWSTTLTIAVTPGSTTGNVVGYRLLAFYP